MEKWNIKLLLLSTLSIGLFMSFTQQDPLITSLEKKFKTQIDKRVQRIYFIDETNISCLNCVVEFENYINKLPTTSYNLVLINNVNNIISRASKINKENCVLIYDKKKQKFDDLNMGIVYLNNRKIDSVINITPINIQSSLEKDFIIYKK